MGTPNKWALMSVEADNGTVMQTLHRVVGLTKISMLARIEEDQVLLQPPVNM